ncbi:MAG: M1 family aminopeptidase [Candidatus Aminicenantes bacterium]|nr:M1 family aminopeptidase [Candidatus Aminicenantes bacterium]
MSTVIRQIRFRSGGIFPALFLLAFILLLAGFRLPPVAGSVGFSPPVPISTSINRDSRLAEEEPELPSVTHYDLRFQLFTKDNNLEAEASMTVLNTTSAPLSEIPLILYRLFDVEEVTDGKGAPLSSTGTIVKFSDEKSLQVRFISVRLARPLLPGESSVVRLKYAGPLWGYPEVMRYVQDRIDDNYSLLRPDSLAYPMLGSPSFQSMMAAWRSQFTYRVEAEVPDGLVVACGGRPVETVRKAGTAVFKFESLKPTFRIDVAAARFEVIQDEDAGIRVYVIPGDEAEALRILDTAKKSFLFFTRMFGELGDLPGFTIIEIPEGWGSQASDFYMLLAAAAFRDKTRTSELYHEIAHNWNIRVKPAIQRCRYFDEAFASYFQGLAIRDFEGEKAFQDYMGMRRDRFLKSCEKDEKNCSTPIADYWKEERGENSYTKGAWSLYALNQAIGDETFRSLVSGFLRESQAQPVDFQDFQVFAEKTIGRSLDAFFKEWIYGTDSSRQLREKLEVGRIAERYR